MSASWYQTGGLGCSVSRWVMGKLPGEIASAEFPVSFPEEQRHEPHSLAWRLVRWGGMRNPQVGAGGPIGANRQEGFE